jgi:hypothetical protein
MADEMLANKLLLETDERRFLATAHRFPYRCKGTGRRSRQEAVEHDQPHRTIQ